MKTTTYKIDAAGRPIGRIASEAASMLIGKKISTTERHILPMVSVKIENASKTKMTEKKRNEKKYVTYSGHPDGYRERSLDQFLVKHGAKGVLREAIWGMLPKNKLRAQMIKNLVITD